MDKDRATGAAKDFAGKVEGAVGNATGDAGMQASGRLREATGTVQNAFGQAKDMARDVGDAASGIAKDAMDAGSDLYQQGNRAVGAQIKEQPLGALLTAGVIGFVLGAILTRQPRRRGIKRYYYG